MENLLTGVSFMIIGMLVVFMFLIIMVIAMSVLKIVVSHINKIFPEQEEVLATVAARDNVEEVAAAIAAAFSKK